MLSVITNALALVAEIALPGSTAALVAKAVDQIGALVPVVIESYKDLLPAVQSSIKALRGSGSITDEDLAKLDAYEAQVDAAFDAADARAEAEDSAADQAGPA